MIESRFHTAGIGPARCNENRLKVMILQPARSGQYLDGESVGKSNRFSQDVRIDTARTHQLRGGGRHFLLAKLGLLNLHSQWSIGVMVVGR